MLKRKLCEAVITWKLTCEGPMLIKDGRFEKPESGYPDTLFISRLNEAEFKKTVTTCNDRPPMTSYYVPGTSLRGPFRSLAERIIRTLVVSSSSPETACDPFEQDSGKDLWSCSKRYEKESSASLKYAKACPACKIFGYAGLASRLQFTDADIKPMANCQAYSSLYRDMVGIDRFTGGVFRGALMRFHVLEKTIFTTTLSFTNFELWQLGLLAYVFRDFAEGLVPIGFGKTKGFGQVKGNVEGIALAYPRQVNSNGLLNHLGSLATDQEFTDYNLDHRDPLPLPLELLAPKTNGLDLFQRFEVKNISLFWEKVAPTFNEFINRLNQPTAADPPEPSGETK